MALRNAFSALAVLGLATLGPIAGAQGGYFPPFSSGALIYPDYGPQYNPPYWMGGYGAQPLYPPQMYQNGSYSYTPGALPGQYGATAYSPAYPAAPYSQYVPAQPQSTRASDSVEVNLGPRNTITIQWRGDNRTVSTMTVSILDLGHKTLQSKNITGLPARATFYITSRAAYYRVQIRYMDGTTSTITSPV
ncbi:MAG TPA: hypothetical protein VGS41_12195 [Chthonomonadales bacterium]|nr:hypothetical protein [Chthonomonadales bacterium]